MSPKSERIAAFFDIDGTLIRGASSWYLARDLFTRGYFGWSDLIFGARHALLYALQGEKVERIAQVRDRCLKVIRGKLASDLVAVGSELYDRALADRVFPGTQKLIARHLRAGHEVWLVSATPDLIAGQMAHRLGVTGGLGTVVDVDEDGVLTGTMPGPLLHGPVKAAAVRRLASQRGLDLAQCYAYSDSASDLELLGLVGKPNVVNPESGLRRIAMARHWPIYDFAARRLDVALAARNSTVPAEIMGTLWAMLLIRRGFLKSLNSLGARSLSQLVSLLWNWWRLRTSPPTHPPAI